MTTKLWLIVLCIIALAIEAFVEMIIYDRTEPDKWIIFIIALINYVSVWFMIIMVGECQTRDNEEVEEQDIYVPINDKNIV